MECFPMGEYIWRHLYDQILNEVWILESCEQSLLWWNKERNVIPRALGWSRKEVFNRFDYNLLFGKEFKVNVDLTATISELKNYFKKLSAAGKRAKIATMDLPMVPRCDSSYLLKEINLKDNVITQLNTRVFKLEAIIQVFGRERTAVSLENLDLRQYFLNMAEDLCAELKNDFNELIGSPLYGICPSIQDNDFDDDDYLIEEEIRLRAEQEESWRLQEQKTMEEVFVKRLKEEVRIRVEKEKLGSSYAMAAKVRDYNNLSDQDMTRFLKDVKPWAEELSRPNRATDRKVLGKFSVLRPNKKGWIMDEAMVGAYFVQILLQDSIPVWYVDGSRYKVTWRDVDQVIMLINETETHWCLAQLDLPSGVVTFYDSGPTFMRMVNDDFQFTPLTSNLQLSCLSPIGTSEGTFSVGDIVLLCGWVLTVNGASVMSFNMLFSLPTNHSVKLIGFTNTDAPIVEVDELGYQLEQTLQIYDLVAKEFRGVGMEADGGSFYIGPYKESLILLNWPDKKLYSLNL
ncbi:phospholipase-like protein [Tanacetum coccineum]